MKNIFVIVGPSASGKDTLFNKLLKNRDWDSLVLHSSRPIRKGERNGVTYNFVDKSFFDNQEDFIQTLEFNEWRYGLHKSELEKINKTGIVILSIKATKQLIAYVSTLEEEYNVYPIYLKVPYKIRLERLLGRGDSIGELYRRLNADRVDFKNIEAELNPFVVNGLKGIKNTSNTVIEYIKSIERGITNE